jgi:hypothetical protein
MTTPNNWVHNKKCYCRLTRILTVVTLPAYLGVFKRDETKRNVRAAILRIRQNFPSEVTLSQKHLHHDIRRIASWDMFTFLIMSHVLT